MRPFKYFYSRNKNGLKTHIFRVYIFTDIQTGAFVNEVAPNYHTEFKGKQKIWFLIYMKVYYKNYTRKSTIPLLRASTGIWFEIVVEK